MNLNEMLFIIRQVAQGKEIKPVPCGAQDLANAVREVVADLLRGYTPALQSAANRLNDALLNYERKQELLKQMIKMILSGPIAPDVPELECEKYLHRGDGSGLGDG
jgi:hypothetical protein